MYNKPKAVSELRRGSDHAEAERTPSRRPSRPPEGDEPWMRMMAGEHPLIPGYQPQADKLDDLFFWAIVSGQREMMMTLWGRVKYPLRCALVGKELCRCVLRPSSTHSSARGRSYCAATSMRGAPFESNCSRALDRRLAVGFGRGSTLTDVAMCRRGRCSISLRRSCRTA